MRSDRKQQEKKQKLKLDASIILAVIYIIAVAAFIAVSYTHLDVYKRQG